MRTMTSALGILVFGTLTACATTKPTSTGSLELYTDTAAIARQTLAGVELSLPWEVKNTGAPATLDGIVWQLAIDDEPLQQGEIKDMAKSVGTHASVADQLVINGSWPTDDDAMTRRAGSMAQRFSASATFRFVGGAEYEAEWNGELAPARPPRLQATMQAQRSDSTVEIHVVMNVKNPNAFGLMSQGVQYTLTIEGKEIAQGSFGTNQAIAAGSELEFDVTKLVTLIDDKDFIKRVMSQSKLSYRLTLELKLPERTFTNNISDQISFR